MHALSLLNNYTPDEVVEVQERTVQALVESVEKGVALPTYRTIAGELGLPVLVVTKMIEMVPDLYEIMQLSRTALANEIEGRLARLAMGEMSGINPETGAATCEVAPVEMAAAKMLLEANSPQYQKKTANITINNPRVLVGQAGKDAAMTALDELNQHFLNC